MTYPSKDRNPMLISSRPVEPVWYLHRMGYLCGHWKNWVGVPSVAQWLTKDPWGHRFSPWPSSVSLGSSVAISCGVGCKHSSDLALLGLWCRLAAAALLWPLAWELPKATGAALERQKKKKKKKAKQTTPKTLPTKRQEFENRQRIWRISLEKIQMGPKHVERCPMSLAFH